MQKVTNELRTIEEKESGMLQLSREVESSRKLYESFLQRVKETNEAQNLQVSKCGERELQEEKVSIQIIINYNNLFLYFDIGASFNAFLSVRHYCITKVSGPYECAS